MHEIFSLFNKHTYFRPQKDHLFKKWGQRAISIPSFVRQIISQFSKCVFSSKKLFKTFAVFEISPKLSHSHLKRFKRGILIKTFFLNDFFSDFYQFSRSSDFQTVWPIVLYFCWVVVDFLESLSPFVLGVFPVSIELLCCVVSMWIYNIKSLEFRYQS